MSSDASRGQARTIASSHASDSADDVEQHDDPVPESDAAPTGRTLDGLDNIPTPDGGAWGEDTTAAEEASDDLNFDSLWVRFSCGQITVAKKTVPKSYSGEDQKKPAAINFEFIHFQKPVHHTTQLEYPISFSGNSADVLTQCMYFAVVAVRDQAISTQHSRNSSRWAFWHASIFGLSWRSA